MRCNARSNWQESFAAANAGLPDDRHIVLRIGINLGDVMVEGGDLYGDGVNIAARLEALAEPGGIYVSRSVRDQVRGKITSELEDIGAQALKNVAEPVEVFRFRMGPPSPPPPHRRHASLTIVPNP